jgi:hypothetical protein
LLFVDTQQQGDGGENDLLVNLSPFASSVVIVPTRPSSVSVAQVRFHSGQFRPGIDVAIPPLPDESTGEKEGEIFVMGAKRDGKVRSMICLKYLYFYP